MKIDAQYRTLPPEVPIAKKNIGFGIVVSGILHVLLIGALVHFTVFKAPQSPQQSVIQAQMLFTPLAQQTFSTPKELTVLPEQNEIDQSDKPLTLKNEQDSVTVDPALTDALNNKEVAVNNEEITSIVENRIEDVEPQQASVAAQTVTEQSITESLTSEIPPIAKEPFISQTPTASTTPIPQDINIPTFDVSELQTQAKERLLKPQGDIGFIIGERQEADSLFSSLPSATATSLHAIQNDKFEESAELFATEYAQSLISPQLIAGPAPLTDTERTQKIIQKSKIDIDCSSALNQTLAIISQFTIQALHCQQNENFQNFIDKRLEKGKK